MANDSTQISIAGSTLSDARHVCALFQDDEEEYRVLLPFITEGFDSGDKSIHLVSPEEEDQHLQRLAGAGIDTATASKQRQFELRRNTDMYLRDGAFDQDRMLRVFQQLADNAASDGFPRSRIVCRMDWASKTRDLVDNVIEFEARVNGIWRRRNDAVVCTYRVDQFRGDAVIDILRTHPMVIIGGVLQRNPFFVPPEQFVDSLRHRRAKRGGQGPTGV